ncbi:GHKL domain-containing protein [Paraburkholderia aspalathi]|nr:GHKL domain-containing protein [Paraburkholderia aspalathi]
MMIAIFIADTVTDLEIAAAVFYVAVVLFCVRFLQKTGVIYVALLCVALTVISYYLSLRGSHQSGIINAVISIAAIGMSTMLALQTRDAQRAVQEAREHMVHMARVMVLGELTASIAHEINQPLAALTTSGHACMRWLAAKPPNIDKAQKAVARIVRDATRASEIIGRVRSLVRREPTPHQWISINDMIQGIIPLLHGDIKRDHITLRLILAENLPRVYAGIIEIEQVLLNLIGNAIESLRQNPQEQRILTITTQLQPDGGGVLTSVADTGSGLETEQMKQMFEPFFSTKPGGMGIGLAISRTIIEAHRGVITAYAQKPRGLVVEFTLSTSGNEPS